MKQEWKNFIYICVGFLICFFLPIGIYRFDNALLEAMHLVKWYAREHVLLCLIPAFFIAGAISVFVSQNSVMKYLGAGANKFIAYGVASVSGTILAVCSCTILPLFAGIYKMGAGIGPATAFLYSGPAINVLAIVLTAKILGPQMGIARAVGAILFSVIIGLLMHLLFRNEEQEKIKKQVMLSEDGAKRNILQNAIYFFSMIGILVFANWGKPESQEGAWFLIYSFKWPVVLFFYFIFLITLWKWFKVRIWKVLINLLLVIILSLVFSNLPMIAFLGGVIGFSIMINTENEELSGWFESSWTFAKQILPLLLMGVLLAGFLLGRVGNEGIIPSQWIVWAVGGNSLMANLFASIAGAFMYFATLTEVPILQGLIGSGMGQGPALALLLAGPALSLPSILVLKSIMGLKKTLVFIALVVVMATISGMIFGYLV